MAPENVTYPLCVAAEIPSVDGVEHRFVDLPEFRVHVAEAGPADARPILLLHGWPQHWYMWRRVLEALGGEHRLIAPDLRGAGWSGAPPTGNDPQTFAADQIALLDALSIDRVRVGGHDWGGYATFLLAIAHPERVERALVFNAPHPWLRPSPSLVLEIWRSWYAVVNALPGIGPWSAKQGFGSHILTSANVSDPFEEDEVRIYTDRFHEADRARASTLLYRSYLREVASGLTRRGSATGRLSVPTRLVFGMRDRFVTHKFLRGWEPHADDMVVEEVPDSGHFIVDEKPALAIERVRELATT
jgi:pimeloyl-ACP methyl ester carboxylesterase